MRCGSAAGLRLQPEKKEGVEENQTKHFWPAGKEKEMAFFIITKTDTNVANKRDASPSWDPYQSIVI